MKLEPSCLAQSSQSILILNKPDYHAVLQRQLKVLNTMELAVKRDARAHTAITMTPVALDLINHPDYN